MLQEYRNIAVVGISGDPEKPSHTVPKFMMSQGYNIIPVNPAADEMMGRKCYPSLREVPEEIDIVNVFRPSEQAMGVVKQAVARHDEKGDVRLIWLQLGIVSEEARKHAIVAGIPYVQDRCIKVEYQRLWLGGP